MSSWNFGGTRGGGLGTDPSGLLDLKALLNQVTGGTLGSSMVGGLGTAVGSGNRSLGLGLGLGIGSGGGGISTNNVRHQQQQQQQQSSYGNHGNGGKFDKMHFI